MPEQEGDVTSNHLKSDYAHILMIDYAETSQHLVSILTNQFKCYVTEVSAKEDILEGLLKHPKLILILDKKTGEVGPASGRYIRDLEKENQLKTTPIVVLLSKKTAIQSEKIDTTDIQEYQAISQINHSLEEILDQWLHSHVQDSVLGIDNDDFDKSVLSSLASLQSSECSDLLNESINVFLEQYDQKTNQITFDWYKKDFDAIKKNAHFMKSSSYTMGANKLARLFGDLEIHFIQDESTFKKKMSDIESSFQNAKTIFKDFNQE